MTVHPLGGLGVRKLIEYAHHQYRLASARKPALPEVVVAVEPDMEAARMKELELKRKRKEAGNDGGPTTRASATKGDSGRIECGT